MKQLEKLALIDMAIKNVQDFITATPDEDHCGDIEYLDSLRTMYLSTLSDNDTQSNKQTMKEMYEVLTEAHDSAMMETLTGIYDNNYIIPKEIPQDEILDFLNEVYLGESKQPSSEVGGLVLGKEWLESNQWWVTAGEMEKHALLSIGFPVYDSHCNFDDEVEEYPCISFDGVDLFAVQTEASCKKHYQQIHFIDGVFVLLH